MPHRPWLSERQQRGCRSERQSRGCATTTSARRGRWNRQAALRQEPGRGAWITRRRHPQGAQRGPVTQSTKLKSASRVVFARCRTRRTFTLGIAPPLGSAAASSCGSSHYAWSAFSPAASCRQRSPTTSCCDTKRRSVPPIRRRHNPDWPASASPRAEPSMFAGGGKRDGLTVERRSGILA
jgi:hypothetical protein